MNKFSSKFCFVSLFTMLVSLNQQSSLAQDEIETVKISDAIHVITGNGGNIGVFIGSDGTFMIDDQFADASDAVMQAVTALGGDRPRFLINTHFHGDHTGGNENFGSAGSTIFAHHNVYKRLAEGSTIEAFNMVAPPAPIAALPVVTFDSDMVFHINDDRVRAVHVPGAHTDGDSIVHFQEANVIHTGDTYFNGFYPFIDIPNGGSVLGMIDAANTALDLADDESVIIPGHGPLAARKDLEAYRDMLVQAQVALMKLKASGMTAEQAVAENPLADLEQTWGNGIFPGEKWIMLIYPGI